MTEPQQVGIDTGLSVWQNRTVFHIGDVVRKLRKLKGWDLKDLAERADKMSMTTLSEFEQGKGNQRRDTIERVAAALGESVPKLYAHLTSMASNRSDDEPSGDDTDVDISARDVSRYQKNVIPVLAEVEASSEGTLNWSDDGKGLKDAERFVSRPEDVKGEAFAVIVRNDSMVPMFAPGTDLIVTPNIAPEDGKPGVVFLKNGERLLKIVYRTPDGGYLLESINRAYPPRSVKKEEVDSICKVKYARF